MKIFVFIVSVLFSLNSLAEIALSHSSVVRFLTKLEDSINQRNYANFIEFYSEDAFFINDLPDELGGESVLSFKDYKIIARDSMAIDRSYIFNINVTDVVIASDGFKAYVSAVTRQKIFEDSLVFQDVKLNQKISIRLIDGKLKITETIARAN